jgi:hypothetical protein
MGGIIGMVLLLDPAYAPRVKALVTMASAVEYADSAWRNLKPLMPLTDAMDFFDLRTIIKIYAPFVVWPAFVAHPPNVSDIIRPRVPPY